MVYVRALNLKFQYLIYHSGLSPCVANYALALSLHDRGGAVSNCVRHHTTADTPTITYNVGRHSPVCVARGCRLLLLAASDREDPLE